MWTSRGIGAWLLMLSVAALGGCDMMGKGTQKALFKLPEGKRVLVMVDPRPSSNAPIDVPVALGQAISQYLYQHRVADSFVAQARLTELRKNEQFARMGIADIARATDSDLVVFVDLVSFNAEMLSEGQVTQGVARGW